jgi:hypothetical protein
MIIHNGILDDLNAFIAKVSDTFGAAVFLVVVVVVLMIAVRARFAMATTLVAAFAGALVIWIVNFNGLGWIAQGIGDETNGQGVTTSVVETEIW